MRTRGRTSRLLVFLAALVVVAGVGVAIFRGVGPLARQHCTAQVGAVKVDLSPDQARYASLISAIGVSRGLPARAVSIALAAAFQESKLNNLDHGDRDSLGLFQQRPSQGWGTSAQIQDPYYSTNAFFDALVKVHGFQTMRITEAAQRVQRSGYPEAYQPHAADARALASALTGYSPGGRFSCVVHQPSGSKGTAASALADLQKGFGPLQTSRGARQDFAVTVGTGLAGQRRGWAVAQYLVAHAAELKIESVAVAGKRWQIGKASKKGWTRYGTKSGTVSVSLG